MAGQLKLLGRRANKAPIWRNAIKPMIVQSGLSFVVVAIVMKIIGLLTKGPHLRHN